MSTPSTPKRSKSQSAISPNKSAKLQSEDAVTSPLRRSPRISKIAQRAAERAEAEKDEADNDEAEAMFEQLEGDDDDVEMAVSAEEKQIESKKDQEKFAAWTQEYSETRNRVSEIIENAIPEVCKTESCFLGIDEAGRGPVCGPMVYAAAFCPLNKTKKLKSMGFADSKQLKEAERDRLFAVIKKHPELIGWKAHVMSAVDIAGGMLGRSKDNLNAQAHRTTIELIKRAIAEGVQLTEIYIDTVGKADIYQRKLEGVFPDLKVTVESKADVKYPIVSAASICAKVTRDAVLTHWKHLEKVGTMGTDYGSGYPSDPSTKAWLQKSCVPIFGFPGLVRFSWSTAKKIMEEKGPEVTWEDDGDDDDDDEAAANTPKLAAFFTTRPRHAYFQNKGLHPVTSF
eukprot:TRINITY_DN11461_c0_g1_i1.p1 TRINITY_DN11461_c0_g1~~TRINITY_DN11461_c0_g1_i1.p1  ORF type:complete len:398 (+),score=98.98 TRINITY_DN11461_c0_g1_i1:668-1861(+)